MTKMHQGMSRPEASSPHEVFSLPAQSRGPGMDTNLWFARVPLRITTGRERENRKRHGGTERKEKKNINFGLGLGLFLHSRKGGMRRKV